MLAFVARLCFGLFLFTSVVNAFADFAPPPPEGGHFVSGDPGCERWRNEGSLGFVDRQPNREASRNLVRCTNDRDHLVTTNVQECYNAGFRVEATLGFVP